MWFFEPKINARSGFLANSPYIPTVQRVTEATARVEGKALYTGTVRYVSATGNNSNTGLDPALPKLTIGSAYAASSHGDIIQLLSNLDMNNESGNGLLLNTADKGVLIRGTVGNPSAITITQSNGTPNYAIRLGTSNLMQFQAITFTSNQTKVMISCLSSNVGASNKAWFKFKDCVFTNTNNSAISGWVFNPASNLTTDTADKFYEFDGCTFNLTNSTGTFAPIYMAYTSTTTTWLLNNCTYNTTGFTSFWHDDKSKSKCCLYGCTFNQSYGQLAVAFGSNTALPDNTGMIVDVRSCSINITATYDPHGFLFGRGTSNVYAVNNNVYIPTTTSSNAIAVVIKTTAGSLGNSYFGGNYVNAPEGILLKGAQYNDIQYNSSLINYSQNGGMTVYNTVEADAPTGIPCTGNRVRNNTFIGATSGITISPTTATIKGKTSMQGWDMDYNNYFGNNLVYIRDQQSPQTDYYLNNRTAFWTSGNNDLNSRMLQTNLINS